MQIIDCTSAPLRDVARANEAAEQFNASEAANEPDPSMRWSARVEMRGERAALVVVDETGEQLGYL